MSEYKYNTQEGWSKMTNFIPSLGDLIVYTDLNKIKIGDGKNHLNKLPFIFNKTYSSCEVSYEIPSSAQVEYFKILTIKPTDNYVDGKIEFYLMSRLGNEPLKILLAVSSHNNEYITNCDVIYQGYNTISPDNLKCYYYKDEKKETSKVEIWIQRPAYEHIGIFIKTIYKRNLEDIWGVEKNDSLPYIFDKEIAATPAQWTGQTSYAEALTSSAGSRRKPIYFLQGKPMECDFELNTDVPENAIFTDTHYSTSLSIGNKDQVNNSTSKDPYLKVKDDDKISSQIQLIGKDNIDIASTPQGEIIFKVENQNTEIKHYTPIRKDNFTLSKSSKGVISEIQLERDGKGHVVDLKIKETALPEDKNDKTSSSQKESKLYILGAMRQSQEGVETYTNSKVYIDEEGFIYSNGQRVRTAEQPAGSARIPVYINEDSQFIPCDQFAGGTAIILNGQDRSGAAASFYAPLTLGKKGQILRSNGEGLYWSDEKQQTSYSLINHNTTLEWGRKSAIAKFNDEELTVSLPKLELASLETNGLMSIEDKKQLNSLSEKLNQLPAFGKEFSDLDNTITLNLGRGLKLDGSNIVLSLNSFDTIAQQKEKIYPVGLDTNGNLAVYLPLEIPELNEIEAQGANGLVLESNQTGNKIQILGRIETMVGASDKSDGTLGLAPIPKAGQQNLYLRGDGTWARPQDTIYTLPAASKTELGGVKIGNNISNNKGLIYLTDLNIINALGYKPLAESVPMLLSNNEKRNILYTFDKPIENFNNSIAIGDGLLLSDNQIILGKYNQKDNSKVFVLGNGTDDNHRNNIFSISQQGEIQGNSYIAVGETGYAETFEFLDKQTMDMIAGEALFVSIKSQGKVAIANSTDHIDGVIVQSAGCINQQFKSETSITIGLLGQLIVRDNGFCYPGGFCKCGDGGIATISGEPGWRVLSRIDDNHIRILFK